jgi:prophage regulatory protein
VDRNEFAKHGASMPTTTPENRRLSRLPRLIQWVGLSRSSIYAMVACGKFPAPINIGERAVAWIDSEIEEWIRSRVEASRGGMSADRVSR